MSDPYRSLIEQFPASVEITRTRNREAVEFRLAGPLLSVNAEVNRIKNLCRGRAWLRMMGPVRWGDDYVVHGVLRERGRLIPPDAQHVGKLHPRPPQGD